MNNRLEVLEAYAKRGTEQARQSESDKFGIQNSIKAITGMQRAGADPEVEAEKKKSEEDFRAKVNANEAWKTRFGGAWETIAEAEAKDAPRFHCDLARRLDSTLDNFARRLVEYVAEVKKS